MNRSEKYREITGFSEAEPNGPGSGRKAAGVVFKVAPALMAAWLAAEKCRIPQIASRIATGGDVSERAFQSSPQIGVGRIEAIKKWVQNQSMEGLAVGAAVELGIVATVYGGINWLEHRSANSESRLNEFILNGLRGSVAGFLTALTIDPYCPRTTTLTVSAVTGVVSFVEAYISR